MGVSVCLMLPLSLGCLTQVTFVPARLSRRSKYKAGKDLERPGRARRTRISPLESTLSTSIAPAIRSQSRTFSIFYPVACVDFGSWVDVSGGEGTCCDTLFDPIGHISAWNVCSKRSDSWTHRLRFTSGDSQTRRDTCKSRETQASPFLHRSLCPQRQETTWRWWRRESEVVSTGAKQRNRAMKRKKKMKTMSHSEWTNRRKRKRNTEGKTPTAGLFQTISEERSWSRKRDWFVGGKAVSTKSCLRLAHALRNRKYR